MLPSTLASKYIEKIAQKFTDSSTEFLACCFTKTRRDKETWQGLTKSVSDIEYITQTIVSILQKERFDRYIL